MSRSEEPGAAVARSGVIDPSERLSAGVIWAFSLPSVAIGFTGLLFGMYLMNYATDVLRIAPAAMGTLLLVSRIWDGISDPMAGYLSDRTRSRFGRRRSWMFAAAIPMGLTLMMMWSPPRALDGVALVAWMAMALLLYETASTAFFVPHGALGVELTKDYHERTRLFGYRHLISFLGAALGLAGYWVITNSGDERSAASALTAVGGVAVAAIILLTTWKLPERAEYQGRATSDLVPSIQDVFRNPHARLLLILFGIETFGVSAIGLLVPYVMKYVLLFPGGAATVIGAYLGPQALLAPVWIRLSRRFGKRDLWVGSQIVTFFMFLGFFFVTSEDTTLLHVLAFIAGVAGGCGAVVAPSIQADVIDFDEYVTGERKEGSYLAVWNFVRKSAAALTAGVTGYALSFSGFEPGEEQSEAVILTLRVLFSLMPAACYAIGIMILLRFSFNEPEHAEVRRALALRESEAEPLERL